MTRRPLSAGLAAAALIASAAALTACGDKERSAEAETAAAEAEVTTKLPESQVSDQQLQAAAEGAAAVAETPQAGTSVVVSPEPTAPATGSGAQPSGGAAAPH
ncbi:hypothetical protein [Phenylobacterium sp.]|jgi:hypothetical protein|uniref:hypothetical protein n=1 Tax=Phenylobacterium sp. TaxID=1871053 RepID=UPI002F936D94